MTSLVLWALNYLLYIYIIRTKRLFTIRYISVIVFIWLSFINALIIQLYSNNRLFAISEKGIYYEQRFCDYCNTRVKLEIRVSLTIDSSIFGHPPFFGDLAANFRRENIFARWFEFTSRMHFNASIIVFFSSVAYCGSEVGVVSFTHLRKSRR